MPIIEVKYEDQKKSLERVTIALDVGTASLFKKLRDDSGLSQSELMREALKFYGKHRSLFDLAEDEEVYMHAEMLSAGEHVILDIDHWILFLNFIESHLDQEKFWERHKKVSRAHAEQFKHKLYNAESIVKRLEICNLFQMSKTSKTEFTLIFGSELSKKFIRTELEEIFQGMGFMVDIKDDFSKLRLKVIHDL
jgi:hypothetical protein